MDQILLAAVALLLLVGAYYLVKLSKISCEGNWRILAEARVASKAKFYPALGYGVLIVLFIVFIKVFNFAFDVFTCVFMVLLALMGVFYTINQSYAKIAEEGVVFGKWSKFCVPWERFSRVEIDGDVIRAGRYVFEIVRKFGDLSFRED